MEGAGNNSNDSFTALSLGRSNFADTDLELHQQSVQANNVNIVGADVNGAAASHQPQVDLTSILAAEAGSGGLFLGPMEVGSSSSGRILPHASFTDLFPSPVFGGIYSSGSSSFFYANQAFGTSLSLAGVQAASLGLETELLDANFSWDVRRNISTGATDPMAVADGHCWDVPGSLLPAQPVLPLPFHGNGNPPSPGSPGYSPPAPSTPNSIRTTLSLNISGYSPTAQPENPSTSRAINPRTSTATGNNFQWCPSSFSAHPSSSNEFPKLSMALVGETEDGDPEGSTMDDEIFNFNDEDIDDDGDGEEEYVVDPMLGRPIELSRYKMLYQPVVFPPPNPNAERRARVISEVNIAVAKAYGWGIVTAEDIRSIHRTIFNREAPEEGPNPNGNVRINLGHIAFEQMLQLQERIGTIPTSLIEDVILSYITLHKFQSLSIGPPTHMEHSCSICQVEYVDGDNLAKLQCPHMFHYACAKQWLFGKNECPACNEKVVPADYI